MKKGLQILGLAIFGFYGVLFAALFISILAGCAPQGIETGAPQQLISLLLSAICAFAFYVTVKAGK